MRKLAVGLAFALSILAIMAQPAGALQGESGSGRGVDSVGGPFSFWAKGTGLADGATGTFLYQIPSSGVVLAGHISCMIVTTSDSTRLAMMGGVITRASDPVYNGVTFILQAKDDSPDGFSLDSLNGGDTCITPTGAADIQSGQVTLVDA